MMNSLMVSYVLAVRVPCSLVPRPHPGRAGPGYEARVHAVLTLRGSLALAAVCQILQYDVESRVRRTGGLKIRTPQEQDISV